jgi:hypothetical protein
MSEHERHVAAFEPVMSKRKQLPTIGEGASE